MVMLETDVGSMLLGFKSRSHLKFFSKATVGVRFLLLVINLIVLHLYRHAPARTRGQRSPSGLSFLFHSIKSLLYVHLHLLHPLSPLHMLVCVIYTYTFGLQ